MEIVLLLHNIRSIHNVGSIMRTAEGFGLKSVVFSGYTPHPRVENDPRLPHIIEKIEKELHKTALDAEKLLSVRYCDDPLAVVAEFRQAGYQILALEQSPSSVNLRDFKLRQPALVILGEEVRGIPPELLATADTTLEIPMTGQKESFNVSVATGICLYQLVNF